MERLTFDGNFCDIAQCRELPCPYNNACTQRRVWEKLKAYEDTGLTPKLAQETAEFAIWIYENGIEKIKEWVKADKAGRLMVLPCKVGDTVYRLQYVEESPGRFIVDAVPIKFALIWFDEFGKTVFLTREEAKKELEVIKHG